MTRFQKTQEGINKEIKNINFNEPSRNSDFIEANSNQTSTKIEATIEELSRACSKLKKMGALEYLLNIPPQYLEGDVVKEDCYKIVFSPICNIYATKAATESKAHLIKKETLDKFVFVVYIDRNLDTDNYIDKGSLQLLFDFLTQAFERLDPGISEFNEYFIRWLISDSYDIDDIPPFKQYRQAFS